MIKKATAVLLFVSIGSACVAQTRLTGTVLENGASPVEGANLVVGGDRSFGASTDREGRFALTGLTAGLLRLQVSHIGYAGIDTTLTLAEGANTIDLVMRPSSVLMREAEVSALRAGERKPFARSLMTHSEIQRINTGVDLPYVLDMQPSVVSTSDAGTGVGYTYMRIRGTDATRTNITVNGVPFNDPESQGAFLVNMPDLATSAEDIEVQRGVGTSTNGPAAFGASVNVRTTAVKRDPWGLISVSGGSFNTQRYSVSAGTGLINNHFSVDMRLSSITSDGYIDRATADLKSYFLQAAWMGEKRSLRLITFRGKEVTYQAWGGVPREVIDTNRTYNPYVYENEVDNYDQAHYQLLFDQKLGANAALNITLFRVLGAGYFEQFRPDDELAAYGIPSAVINGDTVGTTDIIRRRWLDNTLTGANINTEVKLGAHRVVVGGSYARYDGTHFGEVIWARWTGNTDIRQRYYDNDATKTDASVFAKITYALTDRIDLFGDAQVRTVQYEFLGFDNDLEDITQKLDYTFFNPKAGAVWRVHEGARVYGSVAIGQREPNREDVQETTPTSRPRSEFMVDYELGYERRSGRLSAGVNAYFMDYTDQLVLTGELNDVGAALRTNVERSYRAGVELMLAAQLTKQLTWRTNATFSRNKVRAFTEHVDDWDNGGQVAFTYGESDLAFSPSIIANSELTYHLWQRAGRGSVDVSLITKYVGDQYLDNSASAYRRLDAYFVNDLRANVTLLGLKGTKGVDFNITVRNLFSELYESNGWSYSYMVDGRRLEFVGLFPQAPLNVLGGVTVRF